MTIRFFKRGDKKDFKSLVWFYFVQQKVVEILSIPFFIFVPYLIGSKISDDWFGGLNVFGTWLVGLTIVLLSIIALVVIVGVLYIFIKSNWNWAKRRASNKLR